jgi:hypothetical protein
MKIAAVKLINGGLKGLEVKYETIKTQEGRSFITEHADVKKTPVHDGLVSKFRELRTYFGELLGYSKEQVESLMANSSIIIHGIQSGQDDFLIKGQIEISHIAGTKYVAVNTPKITEDDDYSNFSKVMSIVDAIYKETAEFMEGKKQMEDKQIVMDFYSKKKGFDQEDLDELSSLDGEELKQKATEILENMGAIVLLQDEVTDETPVRDIKSSKQEEKEQEKIAVNGF